MGRYFRDESVWIGDWSWTGRPSDICPTLKRSISGTVKVSSDVEKFYIGITSGDDMETALQSRFDPKKREWGCNEIWALYSSKSRENTIQLEEELTDHYREWDGFMNERSGGGGRIPDQSRYHLYLGLKRFD